MANPGSFVDSPISSGYHHSISFCAIVLPDDLLKEAIPGNIRKAEHFVAFLKRFVEYLKTRMRVLHVVAETPLSFLQHLKDITFIERRPLRYVDFFSNDGPRNEPRVS
jgi:hypothetical protein